MSAGALHYHIIRGLLDTGACPTKKELSDAMGVDEPDLVALMRELDAVHGVVLHPDRPEPWVIHPFSITPTANWVQGAKHGWWAPCLWCGLGIAHLAGGEVTIHTRLGGETEPVRIVARDGQVTDEYHVHFAIRPREAWNNVHAHCAMLLPFRSPDDVREWTSRHRLPLGEIVPLAQVARFAGKWYGRHADENWQKWSMAEAQAIFHESGLTSEFWSLGEQRGRF